MEVNRLLLSLLVPLIFAEIEENGQCPPLAYFYYIFGKYVIVCLFYVNLELCLHTSEDIKLNLTSLRVDFVLHNIAVNSRELKRNNK